MTTNLADGVTLIIFQRHAVRETFALRRKRGRDALLLRERAFSIYTSGGAGVWPFMVGDCSTEAATLAASSLLMSSV